MTTNDTPRLMAQLAMRFCFTHDEDRFSKLAKRFPEAQELCEMRLSDQLEAYLQNNGYPAITLFLREFFPVKPDYPEQPMTYTQNQICDYILGWLPSLEVAFSTDTIRFALHNSLAMLDDQQDGILAVVARKPKQETVIGHEAALMAAQAAVNTLKRELEREREKRKDAENEAVKSGLETDLVLQGYDDIKRIILKGGSTDDVLKFLNAPKP